MVLPGIVPLFLLFYLVRVLCLPCLSRKGRRHTVTTVMMICTTCVYAGTYQSPPSSHTNRHTTDKPPNSERARNTEEQRSPLVHIIASSTHQHPKRSRAKKTSYVGTNVHQRQKRRRTRTWMIIRTYYSNKQVSDIL